MSVCMGEWLTLHIFLHEFSQFFYSRVVLRIGHLETAGGEQVHRVCVVGCVQVQRVVDTSQ
jgi:hypothetical protein